MESANHSGSNCRVCRLRRVTARDDAERVFRATVLSLVVFGFAVVSSAPTGEPKGAAQPFANAPPEAIKAFSEDRAKMRGGMVRIAPADAAGAYQAYLARVDAMLERNTYMLAPAPTIADFAAYHSLWFTRVCVPIMAGIFDATPRVLEWMDSMAALGHGTSEKFSATEAIALAARSTPAALESSAFQNEHGIALGSLVSITAESFGAESTEGELISATASRYTLRRHDERAGVVHVHFPRVGYVLKAAAT